ncbi:MAG: hypothetical protein WEE50_03040 [Chloroflexota bacterium]
MKRLVGIAGAVLIALVALAPVALAADPMPHTGRVLVSTAGDFTLAADDQADVVVVINGTGTILGEANTIVVVDGALDLQGARTETIFAVRSPVEVGPDSVVLGDVMTLDSLVHQTGNADVQGEVKDLPSMLVGFGVVLAPALLLLWVGFGLAMIAAGLLLAAMAARQVRQAEAIISHEPVMAFATGIVGLIAFPLVGILLIVTLVGAPLGVAVLLQVWPLVAFVGYLIAGIWIGEWVLRLMSPEQIRERPYLAAVIGLLILGFLGIIPVLAIVTALASLFGFGAVLLLAFRTIRSGHQSRPTLAGHLPAPMAT